MDLKDPIGIQEKKQVKSFIEHATKEITLLMKEENKGRLKVHTNVNKVRSKTKNSLRKHSNQKSQLLEEAKKYALPTKQKIKDSPSKSIQVKETQKTWAQISEELRKQEEDKKILQEKKDREWEMNKKKLKLLDEKCIKIKDFLVSKAQDLTKNDWIAKTINAARSSKNRTFCTHIYIANVIQERAHTNQEKSDSLKIKSYINTVDKIEAKRKKKEEDIQKTQENQRKLCTERTQKQILEHQKQCEMNLKVLEDYAKKIQEKDEKTKKNRQV